MRVNRLSSDARSSCACRQSRRLHCRRRRVSARPWSCGILTQGDASAASSAGLVAAPCSVPRCGRGLPRCNAAVRSSPDTWRRCVRSSVYSRGRRSENTHQPCTALIDYTWDRGARIRPYKILKLPTQTVKSTRNLTAQIALVLDIASFYTPIVGL